MTVLSTVETDRVSVVSQARGVTRARAATHCTVDSAPPTGHAHDPPRHCTHSIACLRALRRAAARRSSRGGRFEHVAALIDSICTINKLHTACPCALSRKANCMPAARWRVCHLKCHLCTCHVPLPASRSVPRSRAASVSGLTPFVYGRTLYVRRTGADLDLSARNPLAAVPAPRGARRG
jgi:hypothetical protein